MDLTQQAIQAAIQEKWKKAIEINKNILKNNPQDTKTLNRLAHAYFKTGELRKAKRLYQQVLKIDRANLIAQRNLEKFKNAKAPKRKRITATYPSFLEEPGKTKTLSLVKLASRDKLAQLDIGEALRLNPKKRGISITDQAGQYLGALPDDLAKRLLYLIARGNRYEVSVKLVEKNRLIVFIKETLRGKKNQNITSFPATVAKNPPPKQSPNQP